MFVELEAPQRDLLVELVERRIEELEIAGVNVRPATIHGEAHADGPTQRELLDQLLQQLHESEWDVTA